MEEQQRRACARIRPTVNQLEMIRTGETRGPAPRRRGSCAHRAASVRPLGVMPVKISITALPGVIARSKTRGIVNCADDAKELVLLKWLLALVIALAVLSAVSPWLARRGLGHLPGDVTVRYRGRLYYLPFTTTILLSAALSLLMRLL